MKHNTLFNPHANPAPISSINYQPLNEWRDKYHARRAAENTTADGRTIKHRPVYCTYAVTPSTLSADITDTGKAYMMQAADIMAYTALKSIYVKSGSEYVRGLLNDAVVYFKRQGQDAGRAQADITHNNTYIQDNKEHKYTQKRIQTGYHRAKVDHYAVVSKVGKIKWTATDKALLPVSFMAYGDTIISVPVDNDHSYPIYQTMRVECMDNYSLEWTDKGKEWNTSTLEHTTDYDDLRQEAFITLWELADKGLLYDFDSVWSFAREVYSAVNKYVHRQRAMRVEVENFVKRCIWTDEDGNEEVTAGKITEKRFSKIDMESVYNAVLDTIISNLSGHTAKVADNIRAVYNGMINGLTQQEIADSMGTTQQQISRYVQYLRKVSTAEKVYDTICDMIYSA